MKFTRILPISLMLLGVSLAPAQIVLSDFSSTGQITLADGAAVTQGSGVQTIQMGFTGIVAYSAGALDLSGLNSGQVLAATLRVNGAPAFPANSAGYFTVTLNDTESNELVGFDFPLVGLGPDFTTVNVGLPVGVTVAGLNQVGSFILRSDADPLFTLNITLDNLALVPEPATYGIAAGALALGLVILRRRRSA